MSESAEYLLLGAQRHRHVLGVFHRRIDGSLCNRLANHAVAGCLDTQLGLDGLDGQRFGLDFCHARPVYLGRCQWVHIVMDSRDRL